MPPLLFPLPTTSLLTFSTSLIDPNNAYTTVLADATAARTQLHIALKGIAENQPGSSALAVVDACQGYSPYLQGIAECLDADTLSFRSEPVFGWKAPLTDYPFSPPVLPMPSINAEHLMVLLTYTLASSNYAHSILAALPSYEPTPGSTSKPHLTAEEEKRAATGLARAVDLLCQASGIAQWTAENVCPKLDGVKKAIGRSGKSKWPVEAGEDTYRGLAMMLLADAHVTAIRKLLLPILPHVLFSPPGPPLPSNHPSPSSLAKLYLHVSTSYDSARAHLGVNAVEPASRKLFSKDKDSLDDMVEGEVIPESKRYSRKESILASGLARKWIGVDAGENGKGAKTGEALAWVKDAQARSQESEDGAVREKMKGLSFGKGSEKRKEERKARKGRLERESDDVGAWIKSYQRMNDTVSFQPVPPVSSLTIPSGRPIFTAKTYTPPPNKLGPIRIDDEVDAGEETSRPAEEVYAGKGNYF